MFQGALEISVKYADGSVVSTWASGGAFWGAVFTSGHSDTTGGGKAETVEKGLIEALVCYHQLRGARAMDELARAKHAEKEGGNQ